MAIKTYTFVISGRRSSAKITVPVVFEIEHGLKIEIPGGDGIWLNKRVFKGEERQCSAHAMESFMQDIKYTNIHSVGDKVKVKKAGKGPTDKSCKCIVRVRHKEYPHGPEEMEWVEKNRTFTVPVSLVQLIGDDLWFPSSILKKKLGEGESLVPTGNPNFAAFLQEIDAVAEKLREEDAETAKRIDEQRAAEWEKGAEQRQRDEERRREAAEQKSRRAAELLQKAQLEGEAAIQFCRENYAKKQIEIKLKTSHFDWPELAKEGNSLDKLEIISKLIDLAKKEVPQPDKVLHGVRVKWVDWVGSSNSKHKQENACDDCTVKFFKTKRIIICPDGDEIVKMEGPNLIIGEEKI
jgi:hypothetical protein